MSLSRTARRRRRPTTPVELQLQREFRRAAGFTGCVMCRYEPVDRDTRADYAVQVNYFQAHHIIAKRHLRHLSIEQKWDVRNALGLCQYHHMRHEHHVQRVPRAVLPVGVFEFAAEIDLEWLLDFEYPRPHSD